MAAKAADADDFEAFGRAAARVHETLMERSGNRTLATLSLLLHELVQDYYDRSAELSDRSTVQQAVRSYRKLIRLINAGDAEAAEVHWRKQMSYTINTQDRYRTLDVFRD